MEQHVSDTYVHILKNELIVALGCTEPIAIAYAGALARKVLGAVPQRVNVACSGNIVKNVKGVTVPNSGGLRGIKVAALLGITGGDAKKELAVLESVTDEAREEARRLLAAGVCTTSLVEGKRTLQSPLLQKPAGTLPLWRYAAHTPMWPALKRTAQCCRAARRRAACRRPRPIKPF